jgi:hypothetical protein
MAVFNPYNPNYIMNEWQNMKDRIDKNMQNYQQFQNQFTQQPQQAPITQNFQLAPQNINPNELQSAYANNIEEVKNIFMIKNGIFVNKDLTSAWFKDTEGKIKTFSLIEVIEKDEKDLEIENLKNEINQMKTLLLQKKDNIEETKSKSIKKEEK